MTLLSFVSVCTASSQIDVEKLGDFKSKLNVKLGPALEMGALDKSRLQPTKSPVQTIQRQAQPGKIQLEIEIKSNSTVRWEDGTNLGVKLS